MVDLNYQEYVEKLGFEVVKPLSPASCNIFKASDGDSLVTIKFGEEEVSGSYLNFDWSYMHVITENKVLDRMRGVEGIVEKISFHELGNTAKGKLIALVRKYVEGKLLPFDCVKLTNPDVLVNAVDTLHKNGIARLDLEGFNIVVDLAEIPYIVDLGLCTFEKNTPTKHFERYKALDLSVLDNLLAQYQ